MVVACCVCVRVRMCVDSFKYHSEENVSVAGVSESSPPISIGAHCSPQFGPLAPQYNPQYLLPHAAAADDQRTHRSDDNMSSIMKQLEQSREMQAELQDAIADIQVWLVLCFLLVCIVDK